MDWSSFGVSTTMSLYRIGWAFLLALLVGSGVACAQPKGDEVPVKAQESEGTEAHAAGGHEHEIGHGDASSSMESMTEVRTDLAIFTFAVFVCLFALLGTLAWPKISAALIEREKRIEGAIADAAAKHEEAKRLLAEHEAKLAGAAAEVKAMLDEARQDAEVTKAEIVAEARAAAKAEYDRSKRDIEVALDSATKHLAETSANLAVELAGKVIRETINPAKAQELVREALTKLSATAPSRN
jgi:F-type H+-transporting ATPase subunit b